MKACNSKNKGKQCVQGISVNPVLVKILRYQYKEQQFSRRCSCVHVDSMVEYVPHT
jgi:hypothetical protein